MRSEIGYTGLSLILHNPVEANLRQPDEYLLGETTQLVSILITTTHIINIFTRHVYQQPLDIIDLYDANER